MHVKWSYCLRCTYQKGEVQVKCTENRYTTLIWKVCGCSEQVLVSSVLHQMTTPMYITRGSELREHYPFENIWPQEEKWCGPIILEHQEIAWPNRAVSMTSFTFEYNEPTGHGNQFIHVSLG